MPKLEVDLLNIENLKIDILDIQEGIKLQMIGSIDMERPNETITPYFCDVHDKVLSSNIKLVEIDIINLKFMNSSGIGTLIKWFVKLPLVPDEKKYKIKILYNKNVTWQKKGLNPLTNLAPEQIELIGN